MWTIWLLKTVSTFSILIILLVQETSRTLLTTDIYGFQLWIFVKKTSKKSIVPLTLALLNLPKGKV
jgi:hypothetical protein